MIPAPSQQKATQYRLRSDQQRLRNDCATIAQRLLIDCATIADDCAMIDWCVPKSNCKSDSAPIAKTAPIAKRPAPIAKLTTLIAAIA
jgi:hypothetical protein